MATIVYKTVTPGDTTREACSSIDGSTWTQVGTDALPVNIQQHSIVVHTIDGVDKLLMIGGYTTATSSKVYSSVDGNEWIETGTNALGTGIYQHTSVVYPIDGEDRVWRIGGYTTVASSTVISSVDGITWTSSSSLPVATYRHSSVVFDGKMWIIGGFNATASTRKVYYSTNGITWTEAGTNALPVATYQHSSLVYSVGGVSKMWVIGGYTTAATRKVYSSTDGITWTEAGTDALPVATYQHSSVVYGGKMWVIGGNSTRKVYSSTDGITWTEEGTDALPVATYAHASAVYSIGGTDKMLVIGGYTTAVTGKVYSSTTGTTWTTIGTDALPVATYQHSSVVYPKSGTDKMWAIGGLTTTAIRKVYSSTDGNLWTEAGTNALPVATRQHSSVVYPISGTDKMWVIGGWNGTTVVRKVYSSTDGITWTETGTNALPVATRQHSSVVFDGKMWVIGGYTTTAVRKVYSSTDGITWTEVGTNALPVATYQHSSVVYDGKIWVIGGYTTTTTRKVYWSTDGITWTEAGTDALPVAIYQHSSVVFDDGGGSKMWVIGGGRKVYSSTDGATWTEVGTDILPYAISQHSSIVYPIGGTDEMWTIGGNVGGDYTSMSALSTENKDLVSVDESWIVTCDTFSDTLPATFNGWVTDATRCLYIRPAVQTLSGGALDTNSYRMFVGSPFMVKIQDIGSGGLIVFDNIQFDSTGNSCTAVYVTSSTNPTGTVRLINCKIKLGRSGYSHSNYGVDMDSASSNDVEMFNCILTVEGTACRRQYNKFTAYHCTAVNTNGAGFDLGNSSSSKCKNCYIYASNIAYKNTTGATLINCISSDTTGSSGYTNVSFDLGNFLSTRGSNPFAPADTYSFDCRLTPESALRQRGASLLGETAPWNFIYDIEGKTREDLTKPSIGAYEYRAVSSIGTYSKTVGSGKDYATLEAFNTGEAKKLTDIIWLVVSNVSGAFSAGETIDFDISGAVGTFISLSGGVMRVHLISGTPWRGSETITGVTSSQTAYVDYTSVTNGEIAKAVLDAFVDTTAVSWSSSWGTDHDRYIWAIPDTGAGHVGFYNESFYVLKTAGVAMSMNKNAIIRCERLQIKSTGNCGIRSTSVFDTGVPPTDYALFKKCIIDGATDGVSYTTTTSVPTARPGCVFINSLMFGRSGSGVDSGSGSYNYMSIVNCTMVGTTYGWKGHASSINTKVTNCYCKGTTGGISGIGKYSSATSDTTGTTVVAADDISDMRSIPYDVATFNDITIGAEDLRLKKFTPMIFGRDVTSQLDSTTYMPTATAGTGDFCDDITGRIRRGGSLTVGAYELEPEDIGQTSQTRALTIKPSGTAGVDCDYTSLLTFEAGERVRLPYIWYLTVSNITSTFGSSDQITAEVIATGNGVQLSFGGTLAHYPVGYQTLTISYTIGTIIHTATETSSGIITGTHSTGTINRNNGAWTLVLTAGNAPDNGVNITINYKTTTVFVTSGAVADFLRLSGSEMQIDMYASLMTASPKYNLVPGETIIGSDGASAILVSVDCQFGQILKAECYKGGNLGNFSITRSTATTVYPANVWKSNQRGYVYITAAAGNRHSGVFNEGANGSGTALPTALYYHRVIEYDSKLWALGGYSSRKVYNSTNGLGWTEVGTNALPVIIYNHSSVVYDSKMWIIGGYNSRKVYWSTNGITWTEAGTNALPVVTSQHSSVVFDDGGGSKMWVIGGGPTAVRKVYWSTNGSSWTEAGTNALPVATYQHSSVVFDDGGGSKMWVIGGYTTAGTREVYSSTDGITWTEAGTDALPVATYQHTSVVHDGKMWVIGGENATNKVSSKMYYSTDGITWTETGSNRLPLPIKYTDSVSFNSKLWIIGGIDAMNTPLRSNFYFSDPFLEAVTYADVTGTAMIQNGWTLSLGWTRCEGICVKNVYPTQAGVTIYISCASPIMLDRMICKNFYTTMGTIYTGIETTGWIGHVIKNCAIYCIHSGHGLMGVLYGTGSNVALINCVIYGDNGAIDGGVWTNGFDQNCYLCSSTGNYAYIGTNGPPANLSYTRGTRTATFNGESLSSTLQNIAYNSAALRKTDFGIENFKQAGTRFKDLGTDTIITTGTEIARVTAPVVKPQFSNYLSKFSDFEWYWPRYDAMDVERTGTYSIGINEASPFAGTGNVMFGLGL